MRRWMAVVLLFAVLLCGCMQSVELKERGIVQAIGVDYDDGFYTVTLQIFNPQSTGQTSFDASKLNNKVIQVQGSSISDALRRATLQNGRKMFLGNNKIIVIGRETAEGGISRVLDYFDSDHETRPGTVVLVADGRADEIVSAQINQGIVPANAIGMVVDQSLEDGSAVKSTLMQMSRALESDPKAAYATYVKAGKDYSGEDAVAIEGTALFLNDRMVDTFDTEETRGFLFLKESPQNTILVVENDQVGRVSANINESKRKIQCNIENGIPRFTVEIQAWGTLEELVQEGEEALSQQGEADIENLLARKILEDTQRAMMKALRENKMDIFDLYQVVDRKDHTFWEENKENWGEMLTTVPVDIEVSVHIQRISTDNKEKK